MTKSVSLARLPLLNLRRNPARTVALIVVVATLSALFFGGALAAGNLNTGLHSMRARMGADLIVTPRGTQTQAEALLTNQGPHTFYFLNDIEDQVRAVPGVEQVTTQTYVASLAAGCCDEKVQIIGIDPDTDFVIGPWIASQYPGELNGDQVIVGADISIAPDGKIKLFGHRFPVVAQLAKTGMSLDTSVFVKRSVVPQIVDYSSEVGHPVLPPEHAQNATSAVLVSVADDTNAEDVARAVADTTGLPDLGLILPGGVTATMKTNLDHMVGYGLIFIAGAWLMGVIIAGAVFAFSANERELEFASMRVMGATHQMLVMLVVKEAALIGTIGGVIGVAVASLVMFPFSDVISQHIQLPYLQAASGTVVVLIIVTVVLAVLTGVIASSLAVRRVSRASAISQVV